MVWKGAALFLKNVLGLGKEPYIGRAYEHNKTEHGYKSSLEIGQSNSKIFINYLAQDFQQKT